MKYTDRDGDTWEDAGEGRVKVIITRGEAVDSSESWPKEDAESGWGPLTPVVESTPADFRSAFRAELAVVLQEMADEAYDEYRWRSGADADICFRVHALFEEKAKSLREGTT